MTPRQRTTIVGLRGSGRRKVGVIWSGCRLLLLCSFHARGRRPAGPLSKLANLLYPSNKGGRRRRGCWLADLFVKGINPQIWPPKENASLPFLSLTFSRYDGANLQHSWHFMISCPYFIKRAFLFLLLLLLPSSKMELRASELLLGCSVLIARGRAGGAVTTEEPVTDLDCLSIRLLKMEHGGGGN